MTIGRLSQPLCSKTTCIDFREGLMSCLGSCLVLAVSREWRVEPTGQRIIDVVASGKSGLSTLDRHTAV